ncbi:hypothetical protein [Macrococcus capreoli]|uniref:hypothetical protein n=1 Tax=Macrococcus capreoli TaxID=2982690 RepID=UPI0021D5C5F9|nr:hypothetical protein [Macrococcus sp. TMW 2.2395]MCU7557287.1 hypothetical protein [Macrococcus sp. TMW 2.2395]
MKLQYKVINHDGISKSSKFANDPGECVHHSMNIEGLSQNIYTFKDGTMIVELVFNGEQAIYCDKPISIEGDKLVIQN